MATITLTIDMASPSDLDTIADYYKVDWRPGKKQDSFTFIGARVDLDALHRDYTTGAKVA